MVNGRLDRFAVAVLEGIAKRLWGFSPRLMPVIVEQLGGVRALGWFAANMPRYERTLRAFGPVRTHLLTFFPSTSTPSPNCTSSVRPTSGSG
jgi:hypothetical protein